MRCFLSSKVSYSFSLSRRDYEVIHEEKPKENTTRSCTREEAERSGEETEMVFRSSGPPTDPPTPAMVEPFSEVGMPGMVTQVSAIQSVTETTDRPPCGIESLPIHLRDLLDQTSRHLDDMQQRQLAGVLLRNTDLFPIPGSTWTGHTDAVEHQIVTGDG